MNCRKYRNLPKTPIPKSMPTTELSLYAPFAHHVHCMNAGRFGLPATAHAKQLPAPKSRATCHMLTRCSSSRSNANYKSHSKKQASKRPGFFRSLGKKMAHAIAANCHSLCWGHRLLGFNGQPFTEERPKCASLGSGVVFDAAAKKHHLHVIHEFCQDYC